MLNHIPQEIRSFLSELNQSGSFWLVGGCIRDILLGREPKDWDIVTTTPHVVEGRFPMIGKDFPVYQARVGEHVVEIAAARKERKTGRGHTDFEVELVNDIQEDLQRRDLTINTFIWNDRDGLSHVYGADIDLRLQKLRHVSPAFAEDPLRVFRVARFASQLGFFWNVAEDTLELMRGLKGELAHLPKDRVREELGKSLRSKNPDQFFNVLLYTHCLDTWFPEVQALDEVPQSEIHHPEGDVFTHTMLVLQKSAKLGGCETTRLACLGHDFGKALTTGWPKHHNHEQLGLDPIKDFCARLGYGSQVRTAMMTVAAQHLNMHRFYELRANTKRILAHTANRTVIGIEGFGIACQADAQGRGPDNGEKPYPQREDLHRVQAAIRSVEVDPEWNVDRIHAEQIRAIQRIFP